MLTLTVVERGHAMQQTMRTLVAVFVVVVMSVPAHAATVVTLDFEDLRIDNTAINCGSPTYSAEGLTLTALSDAGNPPAFCAVGTLSPSFSGSVSLYHHIGTREIVLTRTDGGPFQLLSIDLVELPALDVFGQPIDFGPFPVTFVGVRANGKTVTATATVIPFPEVTTVTFHGFTNLVAVHWFQGSGPSPDTATGTHQFDNIVVRIPQ